LNSLAQATNNIVEFGRHKGQRRVQADATMWVDAGLEILRAESIEHVKVEKLASRLGISKGSFYWHFKNKAELHAAILERWESKSLERAVSAIEKRTNKAADRLKSLIELSLWADEVPRAAEIDLAIRAWARRYPPARTAVERLDKNRIAYIQKLFFQMKFTCRESEARAHIAYALIRYLNHARCMGETQKRRIMKSGYDCLVDRRRLTLAKD
jgi:AcrR family transcriptional regulator